MNAWKIYRKNGKNYLKNDSKTLVTTNKKIPFSVVNDLIVVMKFIQFPIEFTEEIEEIKITYLTDKTDGKYYYKNKTIHLNYDKNDFADLASTLIHEIAHHLDRNWKFSDRADLRREWKKKHDLFNIKNIKKDPAEYFAAGFEIYYLDQNKIKTKTPNLYKIIKNIHTQNKKKRKKHI